MSAGTAMSKNIYLAFEIVQKSRNIANSGFRPPYWKWKLMKIMKMSIDCIPTLAAYYRKLTYCLHIIPFAISVTTCKNHPISRKKAKNKWKLINFQSTGGATYENFISPRSTFDRLLNAKNRMKKYGPVLELEGGGWFNLLPLGKRCYKKAWPSAG